MVEYYKILLVYYEKYENIIKIRNFRKIINIIKYYKMLLMYY